MAQKKFDAWTVDVDGHSGRRTDDNIESVVEYVQSILTTHPRARVTIFHSQYTKAEWNKLEDFRGLDEHG